MKILAPPEIFSRPFLLCWAGYGPKDTTSELAGLFSALFL